LRGVVLALVVNDHQLYLRRQLGAGKSLNPFFKTACRVSAYHEQGQILERRGILTYALGVQRPKSARSIDQKGQGKQGSQCRTDQNG